MITSRKFHQFRKHVKKIRTQQLPRLDITDLDLHYHLEQLIYKFNNRRFNAVFNVCGYNTMPSRMVKFVLNYDIHDVENAAAYLQNVK